MKKFVKIVTINDGNPVEVHNGDCLYTETYPRAEKVIEAFLAHGWTLANMLKNFNPSVQKEGAYSFYLGGWDLVFIKETEDGENEGDRILSEVLSQILEGEDTDDAENWDEDEEDFDDIGYLNDEDEYDDDDEEEDEDDEEDEEDDGEYEEEDMSTEVTLEDVIASHECQPYEYEVDEEYAEKNRVHLMEVYAQIQRGERTIESLDTLELIGIHELLKNELKNQQ
ncbi:MAG: hypothetical protein LUF35_05080 [Lachnospiraceae bacterium]|nr:hypothetical protein [Lachnospiraceae bacterium]